MKGLFLHSRRLYNNAKEREVPSPEHTDSVGLVFDLRRPADLRGDHTFGDPDHAPFAVRDVDYVVWVEYASNAETNAAQCTYLSKEFSAVAIFDLAGAAWTRITKESGRSIADSYSCTTPREAFEQFRLTLESQTVT